MVEEDDGAEEEGSNWLRYGWLVARWGFLDDCIFLAVVSWMTVSFRRYLFGGGILDDRIFLATVSWMMGSFWRWWLG